MEGTGGQENLTIPYGGTINEKDLPTPQSPAGEGWTFVSWATKQGDTYIPFNFGTKIYDNIELYPYYTNKNSYTVTYTDGSNSVEDTKQYAPGTYADVRPNTFPVPEGKVFLGWADTADGAVKYQPNDKLRMDASVTLHAVWGDTEGVLSRVYAERRHGERRDGGTDPQQQQGDAQGRDLHPPGLHPHRLEHRRQRQRHELCTRRFCPRDPHRLERPLRAVEGEREYCL